MKFTPEMFHCAIYCDSLGRTDKEGRKLLADIAQAALDKYLSECPVVYCRADDTDFDEVAKSYARWSETLTETKTHQALLFNVEKLEPKECAHAPDSNGTTHRIGSGGLNAVTASCKHCGADIKATWKAEGE